MLLVLWLSVAAHAVPCGAEHLTGTSPNAYGASPTDSPLVLQFQGCDEAAKVPLEVRSKGQAGAVALSTTIEAVPGCTAPLTVPGGWAPSTQYVIAVGGTRMQFRTGERGAPGDETLGALTCDPALPTMPERPKGDRVRKGGDCLDVGGAEEPESALTSSCSTSGKRPGAAFGALGLLAVVCRRRWGRRRDARRRRRSGVGPSPSVSADLRVAQLP